MQKKLIALAIAGLSGAAFAQSNVTISGNLDMGYYSQSMQTVTLMDTRTAAAANGSSTSTWRITGEEALGGGMKAGFQLENDLAAGASSSSSVINAGSSFLSLSGNWGTLKAGNVNTAGLTAGTTAQPFGTAIGGGYSGAFARLSRAGINGTAGTAAASATAGLMAEGEVNTVTAAGTAGLSGARTVRVNSSLHYATPSFSGFSATLQLATKNSDANVAATGNTGGYQGLGLNYNNGPLNVAYANEQMSAGAVAPTGAGVTLGVNEKVTHNLLAANYTFGPATVYGGWTSSKSSVAATADSRSWNLALKYAVSGALSLMANVVKVDDKLIGNQDRSLTGLGLDYALSKRTTAYGRYENGDNDKSNGATGNFSRYQIGMRHSF